MRIVGAWQAPIAPAPVLTPEDSDTIRLRVLREHVASVWATRYASISAHLCFAIMLGVYLWFRYSHPLAFRWIALIAVVDVYVLLVPGWNRSVPIEDSAHWAHRYAFLVTLVSAVSGVAPWFFITRDNMVLTTVIVVVIMVSWTRAVQALWALRSAMLGYGLPMMCGLIVALAAQGDSLHLFLAAFGSAHLFMTLRTGLRQNKVLTEALTLRFENEALAAQLTEQIAATARASLEKTRFLATASHDLRQPLHAIALFGAALQNELRTRPEAQNADRLMNAVTTLGTSLDTMLDVSRLDAGVVSPQLQPVSLDALFLGLNQLFAPRAEQQELQLRVRASGLWVLSDPQQLHRMLSNLLDNAVKYTPRGGVALWARPRGAQVWIEVRDTGIGIAPEQLDRVFEEFYQVDNPGRDRSRGLGIGLSIVRRLGRLLDHRLEVRSRPGRGTLFRLRVAAADRPAGSAAPFTAASRGLPPRAQLPNRVLLLEDEADIRAGLTELLGSHGIDATAVADEAQARAALAEAQRAGMPFECLLCDFRLADGADGLEIGQRLQAEFGPALPMALITGETAPDRLLRVREAGVPVVFKPADPAELLKLLAQTRAR